jgi:hypothetical protein
MRKFFHLLSVCFLSGLLVIAVSCNNGKDEGKTEAVTTNDSNGTNKQPAPALVGGTLDTLWMPTNAFPANGARVVFSVIIDANDKLTLHGWRDNGGPNQFSNAPNYQLTNAGQHNGGTYGPNMYFGNIILRQLDVATINQMISQGNYTKVLFVPEIIGTNHLVYHIFLGNGNAQVEIMAVVPTNTDANPSPPRNY